MKVLPSGVVDEGLRPPRGLVSLRYDTPWPQRHASVPQALAQPLLVLPAEATAGLSE